MAALERPRPDPNFRKIIFHLSKTVQPARWTLGALQCPLSIGKRLGCTAAIRWYSWVRVRAIGSEVIAMSNQNSPSIAIGSKKTTRTPWGEGAPARSARSGQLVGRLPLNGQAQHPVLQGVVPRKPLQIQGTWAPTRIFGKSKCEFRVWCKPPAERA